MPATKFVCKNGSAIPIKQCLSYCPNGQRCMFLPTLRSVAESLNRKLDKPSVTELIAGTRETYLKKVQHYAVDPMQQLYAVHGTAVHTIQEGHNEGNIIAEERLADDITSGKFDLYGQIVDLSDNTLGDYKVTSSFKLMKALGYYKVDVPTGEVYKTGLKKGQPKTRKEWHTDGVRHLLDWAVQLNYYRILLEDAGFKVKDMVIQALCRDYSLRMASERNITRPLYLIRINKISDRWIKLYMAVKAKRLQKAILENHLPARCSTRERWHDRKCQSYCDVVEFCPYGRLIKRAAERAA